MPIAAIAVKTDRTSYCRYLRSVSVVTATVAAAGGASETVSVSLVRQTPWGVRTLISDSVVLSAGSATWKVDLEALKDADGYMLALLSGRSDDYSVVADDGAGHAGSARFTVVASSPEEMKTRWMLGLPLTTKERYAPRLQPQAVSGVVVTDVSQDTPLGIGTLALSVVGPARLLSWASGSQVTLDPSAPGRYVLNGARQGYLVVTVDPAALPAASVSEPLTIDQGTMRDDAIVDQLVSVTKDIVPAIGVFSEPHRVASVALTDPDFLGQGLPRVTEYDHKADGVTYYRPQKTDRWLEFKLPFHRVQKVRQLRGYWNRTLTTSIDHSWIQPTRINGMIQLVPSSSAIISWVFYGPGFYTIFLGIESVPDFWQYEIVAGLPELPPELREWIAKRAAMTLLAQAGAARYGGLQSVSVSRDGVSESRGIGGLYGSLINQYRDETGRDARGREMGLSKFRDRYAGPVMVAL